MLVGVYIHAYVPVHGAGAETTIHDMLRAMVERGHEVEVSLSNQPGPDYEIDGIKVHSYNGFEDRRHPIGLAARCDIMISHLECTQRATLLAHKYLRPAVQLVHNTHQLTTGNLANADLAVFNSHWVKDHHEPLVNRWPESVVVRPMVDPDRYAVRHTDERAITLVNMTEAKGSDIFYALADRLPSRKFLAVEGGYGNQDLRYDIPNVEVVRQTADMREVYKRTKILLMPSSYETWGRVATEGAVSGTPTICTNTPGLTEALASGGNYVDLKDRANIDAWVAQIKRLSTPRGYAAASDRALKRSRELEDIRTADVETWVSAAESVARLKGKRR